MDKLYAAAMAVMTEGASASPRPCLTVPPPTLIHCTLSAPLTSNATHRLTFSPFAPLDAMGKKRTRDAGNTAAAAAAAAVSLSSGSSEAPAATVTDLTHDESSNAVPSNGLEAVAAPAETGASALAAAPCRLRPQRRSAAVADQRVHAQQHQPKLIIQKASNGSKAVVAQADDSDESAEEEEEADSSSVSEEEQPSKRRKGEKANAKGKGKQTAPLLSITWNAAAQPPKSSTSAASSSSKGASAALVGAAALPRGKRKSAGSAKSRRRKQDSDAESEERSGSDSESGQNDSDDDRDAELARTMAEETDDDECEGEQMTPRSSASVKLVDALEVSSLSHWKNDRLEASAVVRSALRCAADKEEQIAAMLNERSSTSGQIITLQALWLPQMTPLRG